jgi:ribonuclease D
VTAKRAGVESCRNGFSPSRYLRAVSAAEMDTGPTRAAPAASYAEADIAHPELFQALKDWRQRKAADDGLAHFQVLHQKTLIQIAVHLPDNLAALMKVKGIGKRLAERYGEELVALVSAYRRKHGIVEVVLPETAAETSSPPKKANAPPKADTKQISLDLFRKGANIAQIAAERGLVVSTIESHLAYFVEQGQLEISDVVEDKKRKVIEQEAAGREGDSLKALKTDLGSEYSYGEIKLVLAHLKHIGNSDSQSR